MQPAAAPCPGHQPHITGLGDPLQMECMAHIPGIRSIRYGPSRLLQAHGQLRVQAQLSGQAGCVDIPLPGTQALHQLLYERELIRVAGPASPTGGPPPGRRRNSLPPLAAHDRSACRPS
ncbi:hypothetical protein DFAR_1810005 [Desulfarculales bacterium]